MANNDSTNSVTPLSGRPIKRLSSFDELYRVAKDRRFANPMRIRVEVDKLRPAVPDLEAFFAEARPGGPDRDYAVVRGTMLNPTQDGRPAVMFRIWLAKDFPSRFPEISVEAPPQGCGWALGNSPNIDAHGTCYLHGVSNWNPPQSSVFACMAELQVSVQRHHPLVRAQGPPQQQHQQQPPPQQHQQHQRQQYPQQQPQQQQPQQYPQQPPQPQPQHHQYQQQPPAPQGPPPPLPQPIGGAPPQPYAQSSPPPPPPTSAPPTAARGMEEVWAMLTTMIFTKGEEELAAGRASFFGASLEQCMQLVAGWGRQLLTDVLMRRRGCEDGLLLPSGALLRRDQVDKPAQRDIFDVLMTAQSSGEAGFLDQAWPLIRADPEWQVKLANTVSVLSSMFGGPEMPSPQGPPARGPPRSMVPIDEIWKGFFSAAFAVGEQAVAEGHLLPREIVDQEPFLYLGLTALTAFGVVKRSPPTGPMRLALGDTDLTAENCPPEGQQLLAAFMAIRDMFVHARFSPGEEADLRRAVLLSGHDRPEQQQHQQQQQRPEAQRIVAGLQSIAVQASQQPTFHQHFGQVLELLAACCAAS